MAAERAVRGAAKRLINVIIVITEKLRATGNGSLMPKKEAKNQLLIGSRIAASIPVTAICPKGRPLSATARSMAASFGATVKVTPKVVRSPLPPLK